MLSLKVLKCWYSLNQACFRVPLFSYRCLNSGFAAAEIPLEKNPVVTNKESYHDGITVTTKEYAEDLDQHKEIDYNEVRTRLRCLEAELTTALRSIRSKRVDRFSEKVHSIFL